MKKLLDAIWEPFDGEDSVEWFLLLFGYTALVFILIGGVIEWT